MIVVASGLLMRVLDHREYRNIFVGMWWAIQTVTTVGYGDVVPGSTAGKVIAGFMMLGGLSLIAVVTGAITSAFVARAQADRRLGFRHALGNGHSLKKSIRDESRRLGAGLLATAGDRLARRIEAPVAGVTLLRAEANHHQGEPGALWPWRSNDRGYGRSPSLAIGAFPILALAGRRRSSLR